MKFQPLPPDQLNEKKYKLLTAGVGTFTILSCVDVVSKKAAAAGETDPDMMKLTLEVYDSNGDKSNIWDYIKADQSWKLHALLSAIGKEYMYENGSVDPSFLVHESGSLIIGIEKSEQYREKNIVKSYLKKEVRQESPKGAFSSPPPKWKPTPQVEVAAPSDIPNFNESDDIPF